MRLRFPKLREHCCLPSEEHNKVDENTSVNQVFGNAVKLKHVLEMIKPLYSFLLPTNDNFYG